MNHFKAFVLFCLVLIALFCCGSGSVQGNSSGLIPRPSSPITSSLPMLSVGTWFPISEINTGHSSEEKSAVSFNTCSNTYLVVWERLVIANRVIIGQRVSSSGALIGSPFLISEATGLNLYPDVTFEPGTCRWLVVFSLDGAGIYARRVNSDGSFYGSTFLIKANTAEHLFGHPAVANGLGYSIIVYLDQQTVAAVKTYNIHGVALSPSTTTPGTPYQLDGGQSEVIQFPEIAYSRIGEFLIVWQRWAGSIEKNNIYGVLATVSAGDLLPMSYVNNIFPANDDMTRPSVGGIAWQDGSVLYGQFLVAASSYDGVTNFPVGQLISDGFSMVGSPFFLNMRLNYSENGDMTAVVGSRTSPYYMATWYMVGASSYSIKTAMIGKVPGQVGYVIDLGGVYPMGPAIEPGLGGKFLVTQDDLISGKIDIFGQFIGNSIFLPITTK